MFAYFQDFYITQRFGASYVITEVVIIVMAVLLMSRLDTLFRAGRRLKSTAVLAAKLTLSFVAVVFCESLLYMLPARNTHALDAVYPLFIAVYALFVSDLKPVTRLSVAPLYYALVLLNMGLSEGIGYILRESTGWNGYTAVFQCLYIIVVFAVLKIFSTQKFDYASPYYAIFIVAVSAVTVVIYHILSPAGLDRLLLIAVDLGYFFLDMLAYFIFWLTAREHNRRIAAEILQEKQESVRRFVRATQENYEKLCALRHDIKNQFAAMSILLDSGDYAGLKSYMGRYFKQYELELNRSNCGNIVLDNLINIEMSKAREAGLKIECEVAVPPVLPFDDADLCSVLTNLLDNAIEAAGMLEISEDDDAASVIALNINCRRDYLFIRVVNACCDLPDGEYIPTGTTKDDKSLHGYGTKIVMRIVKKYHGSVRYMVSNDSFTADVMLAMQTS